MLATCSEICSIGEPSANCTGSTTSDGGALLLKAVDDRLGLSCALAGVIADAREPAKVRHSLTDLLGQRIFGLALDYPDANDVARIGADSGK